MPPHASSLDPYASPFQTFPARILLKDELLPLRRVNGTVEVATTVQVKGDVDMHVGNLSTRFAVVVRGMRLAFAKRNDDGTAYATLLDGAIAVYEKTIYLSGY